MMRVMLSTGNIFFSLMLGLLAGAFVFINFPETAAAILDWAAMLKTWLTDRGLSPEYNNWLRIFLGEAQLVLMGFTIAARLVLSIVMSAGLWVFGFEDR